MTRIRAATTSDLEPIREVHLRAFPESERQLVSTLAANLLGEATGPEAFALVAETDGTVAGHAAFSPVMFDNDEQLTGYILAPLGVQPEYQKQGIGSGLIKKGMERLSQEGVNILFVYGDPKYYGRFGFSEEAAARYSPPYELQYPFGWQAVVLNEGVIPEATVNVSCVAALNDPALW